MKIIPFVASLVLVAISYTSACPYAKDSSVADSERYGSRGYYQRYHGLPTESDSSETKDNHNNDTNVVVNPRRHRELSIRDWIRAIMAKLFGSTLESTIEDATAAIIDLMDRDDELGAKFVRLAFHDCNGGCDGCVDLENPENFGLEIPIGELEPVVEEFERDGLTRADIYALAGLKASEYMQSSGRNAISFDLTGYGRVNCGDSPNGGADVPMPGPHLTTQQIVDFFDNAFGLTARETVAVIGAHTVGRAVRRNSGFNGGGGWVRSDEIMNNEFFEVLLRADGTVNTDFEQQLQDNSDSDIFPDQFMWRLDDRDGRGPFMLNADMALAVDFAGNIDPATGAVSCSIDPNSPNPCNAAATLSIAQEFRNSESTWLSEYHDAFQKMLQNGYTREECDETYCPLTPIG